MHSLTLLFDWLLAASARASLLIMVVLIVQALFGHRVPARWRYALWLPVLIVLLMPGFPESSWSVGSIIRTSPAPLAVPVVMQPDPVLIAAAPVVPASEMSAPIPWQQVVSLAWLIGAAGMVLFSFGALVQTLWRFKRSQVPVSDALLSEVTALAREISLRRAPRVWMASEIRSPAVTGLLHPTLLLPAHFEQTLTALESRFVLRHELTHIKRGDLPLNALLCLLLALHWFNPLLWLAFFKARLDREAACDAQVLDHEQQPERVAYGHTLLKVENAFSHHGLSLGFVGIFQRGIALRSRIVSIAKQPTHHITMKATLSLCIVLLTFLGITKAAPPDKNTPQMLIEAKFIEVSDGAKGLLAPFATTGTKPSVNGMLNDDQLSAFWKKIEQAKGVDVLSMPRATTRSGQEAKIETSREFRYKDAEGKEATKQLGTTLTVIATKGGENDIDLELTPQIIELKSMIKDANSGVEQPVFSERKASASVRMMSGQTVVLGLPSTSTKQTIEDRSAGRVTTKTENVTRHTMIFVTARLVDPATAKPADPKPAAKKTPLQTKLDTIVIPKIQFSDATLEEAVAYLRQISSDLDTSTKDPNQKGVNMILKTNASSDSAKITLDLKDVSLSQALRYVIEVANLKMTVDPFAVTLATTAKKPAEATAVSKLAAATSADKIILPSVEFRDATLAEAIEFIRIKSHEHDPDKKGVNILLKGDGGTVKITLSLKDVPISDALHYCAELANHKLSADDSTFVLAPAPPKAGTTTSQLKPTNDGAPGANAEAQALAAELRRAKPQQYDFAKADLGDVIRFLAADAGIRFFSLPEDHPTSQRLITFSVRGSPFEVLETICKANNVVLVLEKNVWHVRAADVSALVRKDYPRPGTRIPIKMLLDDLRDLMDASISDTQPQQLPQHSASFKEDENVVHVVATRMQHTWVAGYLDAVNNGEKRRKERVVRLQSDRISSDTQLGTTTYSGKVTGTVGEITVQAEKVVYEPKACLLLLYPPCTFTQDGKKVVSKEGDVETHTITTADPS